MNWKYKDSTNTVVYRITALGCESCLVSSLDSQTLSQVLPADPLPIPTKEQQILNLLIPIGLTQPWQVDAAIAGMIGGAASQSPSINATQLAQINPAFAEALSLRNQILLIQADP